MLLAKDDVVALLQEVVEVVNEGLVPVEVGLLLNDVGDVDPRSEGLYAALLLEVD